MEAYAYSPGHITGMFQTFSQHPNPLYRGSRGGGICLKLGVYTRVRAKPSFKPETIITVNGRRSWAPVSMRLIDIYRRVSDTNYSFIAEHEIDLPVGSGFGTSGAGALSLSLALNELLNLGLSRSEAAQLAHLAELECKTGLGTVMAESLGGIELRTKEGAPGIGRAIKIEPMDKRTLVALHLGPLPTRLMLSDKDVHRRVQRAAYGLMDMMIKEPTIKNLLRCFNTFTERAELATSRVKAALSLLQKKGWEGAMAMFGEVVFTLVREEEADEVERVLSLFGYGDIIVSQVEPEGARLLC